eukprot:1243109-Amphidinium_carterae.1
MAPKNDVNAMAWNNLSAYRYFSDKPWETPAVWLMVEAGKHKQLTMTQDEWIGDGVGTPEKDEASICVEDGKPDKQIAFKLWSFFTGESLRKSNKLLTHSVPLLKEILQAKVAAEGGTCGDNFAVDFRAIGHYVLQDL